MNGKEGREGKEKEAEAQDPTRNLPTTHNILPGSSAGKGSPRLVRSPGELSHPLADCPTLPSTPGGARPPCSQLPPVVGRSGQSGTRPQAPGPPGRLAVTRRVKAETEGRGEREGVQEQLGRHNGQSAATSCTRGERGESQQWF